MLWELNDAVFVFYLLKTLVIFLFLITKSSVWLIDRGFWLDAQASVRGALHPLSPRTFNRRTSHWPFPPMTGLQPEWLLLPELRCLFTWKTQLSICFHIPPYFSLSPMPWFLDNLRFIAVSSAVPELHSYSQENKTTNLVDYKWYEQPHSRILKSNSLLQKVSFTILQFPKNISLTSNSSLTWENSEAMFAHQLLGRKGHPAEYSIWVKSELKWLSSNGCWSEFLIQEQFKLSQTRLPWAGKSFDAIRLSPQSKHSFQFHCKFC